MFNTQDIHLLEMDYIHQVAKYLRDHFGKTIDELALSAKEVAKGLHDNLHPSEYVQNNAKGWGIHRLGSSIPGSAKRYSIA